MSTSLYWEPVKTVPSKSLSDQLKYIFGPTYWGHDGTCHGEEVVLRDDQLSYLCGVRNGTRDKDVKRDCETLIAAIQKYGAVKIWLES